VSEPAARRYLVVCDGAPVPPDLDGQEWEDRIDVNATGPKPTMTLKVESLAAKVIATLDGRAQDLVRIGAACYGADQLAPRGGNDIHREQWRRLFCVVIPVIDVAFWSDPDVLTALGEALGFGTEDTWEFRPTQRPAETANMRLGFTEGPLIGSPDCVLLFSGGTDSLCALVEAVAEHRLRPLVVSHRSAPQVDHAQKQLLAAFKARFPGWTIPPMSFWIHKTGVHESDTSQRTRGFLYAALGTAAASQVGLSRVLLADNGYVSINPPISGQLVGALASRGTHPAFLRLFNRLAALMYSDAVRVENPLALRTRAEALKVLSRHKVPELLELTRTCGKHRHRTEEQPHCGGCSQCVDRRFSAIAAGMRKHDPAHRYGLDVFRHELPVGEPRTIAFSYADFARRAKGLTAGAYFAANPELVAALDLEARPFAAHAEAVGQVLLRHGKDVRRVYTHEIRANAEALGDGSLPEFGLLRMLIATRSVAEVLAEEREDGSTPTLPEDAAIGAECYFRRRGRHWYYAFLGEKGELDDGVGVRRLARLLKAQGQGLWALDLVAGSVAGNTPHPDEDSSDVDEERRGFAQAQPGTKDREAVAATIDLKEQRAREIGGEFRTDGELLSERKRELLRAELEQLAGDILGLKRLRGRTPGERDDFEKARTRVWHSLDEAYKTIAFESPKFVEHLRASIATGTTCVYDPHPRIPWDVRL
jgi:hypothetical protein